MSKIIRNTLNPQQQSVVDLGDGPCLVLAGAGSGKTKTITHRVAHLLENGVSPDEILLVTFTNKAAHEMKNRVQEIMQGKAKLTWSGTFHHICYRIMRMYAPLLQYQPNFTVLDSEDARNLMKMCLKHEGLDKKNKRYPSANVLSHMVSFARNANMSLQTLIEEKYPHWDAISDTLVSIASDYARRKKLANVMDFDDLLVNIVLLMHKAPQIREKFAKQFKYVLVDEYQDTNAIQAELIKLLSSHHGNILVVGDDAQSIYSFRAADVANILRFEHDFPQAKIFKLETNYRSTPNILDIANEVIQNNTNQYEKRLVSERTPSVVPTLFACTDNYDEANRIADEIVRLHDEGMPFNEIAVLFRATHHPQVLEMELAKRDIPYEFRGGLRFFERAHVKDVLSFLRIFHNQQDVIAWARVLTMQVGIGPSIAQKIIDIASKSIERADILAIEIKLGARALVGFNNFKSIWEHMLAHTAHEVTTAKLIGAVRSSQYEQYLKAEYPDFQDRLADLEQLEEFAQSQPDVEQFLSEATLQEGYARALTAQTDTLQSDADGAVVLSTIHQAKGLEWDAVFVMHLCAGQFPNERALREKGGLEEERRLFYVAVTRAKTMLFLSYPLVANTHSVMYGPSCFIDEIPKTMVQEQGFAADTIFDDPSDDIDDIVYEPLDEDMPRSSFGKPAPSSFLKSIDDL